MTKPLILLTNDDGINALGIYALARATANLGEVVIVAPDSERSAAGHGITLSEPLRAEEVFKDGTFYGYAVNGTPADAVKVGVKALLPRAPDLVISGINLGPNTGINVIYSGTVSAATEAAIMGIDAIAVSLGTFVKPDYTAAAHFASYLGGRILSRPPGPRLLLNVNGPAIPEREIRGVKLTHQGTARFDETLEKRSDLRGRIYYWLGGEFRTGDEDESSDSKALSAHCISITPLHFDMTDYRLLSELKDWKFDGWGPR
ncbi:MAG: 5'/3'-nucleotidase SurE [Candidatus Aureabacteria bacterium]|nr:5'/3'-nucleotidase SurE [Candidatus Auribacterota bacterium]